jgi:hypothetical protein
MGSELLDELKKFYDLIGSRTRDLPACSIAPPRWPMMLGGESNLGSSTLRNSGRPL